MKIYIYFMCLCLLFTLNTNAQDNNQQMFIDMLNQYRIENGLNPVKYCQELTDLAQKHCDYLVKYNNNQHTIIRKHSLYGKIENLDSREIKSDDIPTYVKDFERWFKSPDHKNNMLMNVTRVGYTNSTLKIVGTKKTYIFSILLLE